MEILSILIIIIFAILILYAYVSTFILFYTAYMVSKGRDLDCKPTFVTKFFNEHEYLIFVGSLFLLIFFFWPGFERILFFIPENLGGINEDGDWQSTKETLSILFAFATSVIVITKLENYIKKN